MAKFKIGDEVIMNDFRFGRQYEELAVLTLTCLTHTPLPSLTRVIFLLMLR